MKKKPIKKAAKKVAKKTSKKTKSKGIATKQAKRETAKADEAFRFNTENKAEEKQREEMLEFFGKNLFDEEKHKKIMTAIFKKFGEQDSFTMREIVLAFEPYAGDLPLRQLLWMVAKMTSKLTMDHINYHHQMISRPDFLLRQILGLR